MDEIKEEKRSFGMIKFMDVPFSHYRKGKLVQTKQSRRVMKVMGKEMKAGKAIDFHQSQPLVAHAPMGKADYRDGTVYDTISLTISP